MTIASIKKQLAALMAIVKPSTSLAARIEKLPAEQRDWYDGWKAHCERWYTRSKARADEDQRESLPYQCALEGYGPVDLREDISIALYGPKPIIPITATEDDAARIYREYCDA